MADLSIAYGGFQIQESKCKLCCGHSKPKKYFEINGKQITKQQLKSTKDPINLGLTVNEYNYLIKLIKSKPNKV
jgi:hypothetical protein